MKGNTIMLNEEIERIKSLFTEERLFGNIVEKELLYETIIKPKHVKSLWDDIIKLGDDIVDSNISKKLKVIFDDDILTNIKYKKGMESTISSLKKIIDNADPAFGVQTQRDQLVKFFQSNKISNSVNDTFDEMIEGLDKEVRNYKLDSGETVESFLRKRQENITSLYKELENETGDILADPKRHNINNKEQMDEFIDDYKETFGEDLPFLTDDFDDDILSDSMRKTYDPDNKVIFDLDGVDDIDAPTKSRLQKFKDDLDRLLKNFNQTKFKKLLDGLYQWLIDTYDKVFNKFLYSNAFKRRQKWLDYAQKSGIDKNGVAYKYTVKPAIIGFNKILTAFDALLAANTVWLIPTLRTLRKVFLTQSDWIARNPKIGKFMDNFLGIIANTIVYVYSYFPVAFWSGDEERAENARKRMASVQTVANWFYLDTNNIVKNLTDISMWIVDVPCRVDPEGCEKYRKELEEMQVKAENAKQNIKNTANTAKNFVSEKGQNFKNNYKKAKKCLDSIGDKRTEFLKELDETNSNPDEGYKNTIFASFESGEINMETMITSLNSLINDMTSSGSEKERKGEEANSILDECDSYVTEILKKCQMMKKQKEEIGTTNSGLE